MSRLTHKAGRPSRYRKQLQADPSWEEVRYQIRCRDGHTCICCGKTHRLEVHHISYFVAGKSIRGNEMNYLEWMALVCEDCHIQIHQSISHPLNPKNHSKININEYKYRYRP